MGTKEEILGIDDLPVVEVPVPEWGGRSIRLKTLSASERDAYELDVFNEREAAKASSRKLSNPRARLLVFCIVDAEGKRVFGDADVAALGAKSGAALDRLYDKAREVNGYSAQDAKALEKS